MPAVTSGMLCKIVGGKFVNGGSDVKIKGITSRCVNVVPGQLYFDVKGGRGGDTNILEALKRGACAIVISKHKRVLPFNDPEIAVIAVPKVWDAFWATIKFYRELYPMPVVGITGTSGKTTTTEMISSIFRRRWKTLKTLGNLNLPHYLPNFIMRLRFGYQAAVFELGMNRPGHVSKQSRIAQPQVGVITHIGTAHVEHLGSYENVIKEKAGIIEGIPEGGYLVLNADDEGTRQVDTSNFKGKIIYYGLKSPAEYIADNILFNDSGTCFSTVIDGKKHAFFIPTFGRHNVYNALAAIAVARIYKFEVKVIQKGLANYRKPKMRLQIVKGINSSTLINDSYNANPDSMMAGLEVLSSLSEGKTGIAVLGNMLEQGAWAVENHRKVGQKAAELGIDWLVTVGVLAKEIAKGAAVKPGKMKIWSFFLKKHALAFLKQNIPKDSVVLFKGSRGAYLERLVKGLSRE